MGGGSDYNGDVEERARSSATFQEHAQTMRSTAPQERRCHPSLDPHGKVRECRDIAEHPETTPIASVADLTKSRGRDTEVLYAKTPMFMGQIVRNGYAPHPEICMAGFGDTYVDVAPVQIGQFESTNTADKDMRNMWPEGGGGGTGQESAQLAAYFFAYCTELDCLKRGKKGFLFFSTDEGFYPTATKEELQRILGVEVDHDVPAAKIFRDLQEKFRVFMIFPRRIWEERKSDIDQEIKQRVERAGGLVEGVDIRFTLVWNNRNDLDLHVQTPDGYHLFFHAMRSPCGGFLDVDSNRSGETTKPVENIRWEKGKGKPGQYKVWVENYAFHEGSRAATDFRVEIEINGEVSHFEGTTPAGATHNDSRVDIGTFDYDPSRGQKGKEDGRYDLYKDDVVIDQWASVIPREQILLIQDPKAVVDVMLGAIAIANGVRDLDGYVRDVMNRPLEENGTKYKPQTPERIEDIRTALADFAALSTVSTVNVAPAQGGSTAARLDRKGKSQRL